VAQSEHQLVRDPLVAAPLAGVDVRGSIAVGAAQMAHGAAQLAHRLREVVPHSLRIEPRTVDLLRVQDHSAIEPLRRQRLPQSVRYGDHQAFATPQTVLEVARAERHGVLKVRVDERGVVAGLRPAGQPGHAREAHLVLEEPPRAAFADVAGKLRRAVGRVIELVAA
jgi:hypothetical protein